MTSSASPRAVDARRQTSSVPAIPVVSWTYGVSVAAALVAALAGALTLFVPGVLRGPAVMNGSGRGTAAVVLLLAVPLFALAMVEVARGSLRFVIVWLGVASYLVYNSVLFLFITPFNQLFLIYVAMFALSFWTLVAVLHTIDVPSFALCYSSKLPARSIATYVAIVGSLNGLAWLRNVVPGVLTSQTPAWLNGTGNITNPVYVQDLAFWVPLQIIAAVWLWRRTPWGLVIAGGVLVFGFIEAIGIAVDQWMGSAADPTSTVASATATPAFLMVAAIQLIPTILYVRGLGRRDAT